MMKEPGTAPCSIAAVAPAATLTIDGVGTTSASSLMSACLALEAAGVECELGPLGTSAAGESDDVLQAVLAAVSAALSNGADTVTLQVRRADG